jgi:hypothetical protein
MTRAQAKFITPVPRVDDTLLRCTIFPGRESEKGHERRIRAYALAAGRPQTGDQARCGEDNPDEPIKA